MLASAAILGVLLAFVAQMLVASAAQQRAAARRTLAMNELANLAERVAALDYDQLNAERLEEFELSKAAAQSFPAADLTFEVHPEVDPPAGKRIAIALAWSETAGAPAARLQLVTWKYAIGEDAP